MRFLLSALLAVFSVGPTLADGFKAGTASHVITPTEPLWMAGYANRNKPCDTKRHDLWVKALAIEDPAGNRCVLLTSDLCGIPRWMSESICAAATDLLGLKREAIMLTCSHTHCGPVLLGNLSDMYELTPEQPRRIEQYTFNLARLMFEAI